MASGSFLMARLTGLEIMSWHYPILPYLSNVQTLTHLWNSCLYPDWVESRKTVYRVYLVTAPDPAESPATIRV